MTKSKYDNSPTEEKLFSATLDIAGAEYSKDIYGCGGEMEEDAKQRLNELAKPITAEECRAIGAPAQDVVNPSQGTLTTQMRDTAKSPNAINALAQAERVHLAKDARCMALAADMTESIVPQNSMERTLSHQMAAAHELAMRFMEKSLYWLDDAKPSTNLDDRGKAYYAHAQASIEAVRLANAAARLMKASQEGMLTLAKLRGGGQQQVTVVHQHVQVAGGNVAVAGSVTQGVGGNNAGGGNGKNRVQSHAP